MPGGQRPAFEITEVLFSPVRMRIIHYWPRFLARPNTGTAGNRINRGTPPQPQLPTTTSACNYSHEYPYTPETSVLMASARAI